jgi:hypothetical protein
VVSTKSGQVQVTLVFDKGNNSQHNLELVAREGLHFVSALVPSQHKDILAVPLASYREVNPARWPQLLSYRTSKKVFATPRVVVATFNPALWAGQIQGLNAQRAKIDTALLALQAKLARWGQHPTPKGKRPTPQSVGRVIARILRGREPGPFLRYRVIADADGVVQLTFDWDDAALQSMIDRHFGKTLHSATAPTGAMSRSSPPTAARPRSRTPTSSGRIPIASAGAPCCTGPTRRCGSTRPTAHSP